MPAASDGRPARPRRHGDMTRAGRLDPVDEVDVLHDGVVRPKSPEGGEDASPQKQDLVRRHRIILLQIYLYEVA